MCHEPFVKDKTSLQFVLKSWMCQHASQAPQKGQWGEKLCSLQFPLQ